MRSSKKKKRTLLQIIFYIAPLLYCLQLYGAEKTGVIAIIMDDLGSNSDRADQLIRMPLQITYSFLPHTPFAKIMAREAHAQGKEVMLHMPMEPISNMDMGPGGLSMDMSQNRFLSTIREAIEAVPFAVGVNNHMGSLLTRSPKNMHWLMQALKAENNFYFVDSRTHGDTVAAQMANRSHLQNTSRDIFLDHVVEKNAIDDQFKQLLSRAKKIGHALAIGHPHRLTIEALEYWSEIIAEQGIMLVPVSEYIKSIDVDKGNGRIWQASLSLSHKAAKN